MDVISCITHPRAIRLSSGVSVHMHSMLAIHAPKRACVPETGQEGLESAKSKVGHDGERQRCQRREDQIGIVDGRGSGLAQPQRSWRRAIAGGILQVVLYALMNEGQWISAMIRYMRYSQVEDLRQGVEIA